MKLKRKFRLSNILFMSAVGLIILNSLLFKPYFGWTGSADSSLGNIYNLLMSLLLLSAVYYYISCIDDMIKWFIQIQEQTPRLYFENRKCPKCGCTESNACTHPDFGTCWWVNDSIDTCSHCFFEEIAKDPHTEHPSN